MDSLLNLQNLSDQILYDLCRQYGARALFWRRKFIGLLPEVSKRRLWEKKGFSSIFHFAKVLAGLSEEQVRRVLNLEKKFEKTPILQEMLVSGKISANKLARVASIATPENQLFLANQAELLSKSALDTLIRDEKIIKQNENRETHGNYQNGFPKPNIRPKSVPGHMNPQQDQDNVKFQNGELSSDHNKKEEYQSTKTENSQYISTKLNFSDEVQRKLLELQNKGIDINEMILEFLKKREIEIAQEKEEIAAEEKQKLEHLQEIWRTDRVKTSRYIRKDIRNIIRKEHGTKCSVPNCRKKAKEIHHQNRFSLSLVHDPRFMVPFCEEHHQIAHSIDLKFHEKRMAAFGKIK